MIGYSFKILFQGLSGLTHTPTSEGEKMVGLHDTLEKTGTQRNREAFPRPHSLSVVGFHYKLGPLGSRLQSLFPLTTIMTIKEADLLGSEETPDFSIPHSFVA